MSFSPNFDNQYFSGPEDDERNENDYTQEEQDHVDAIFPEEYDEHNERRLFEYLRSFCNPEFHRLGMTDKLKIYQQYIPDKTDDDEGSHCCCGAKIKNRVYIVNFLNGNRIFVGNVCVLKMGPRFGD